MMLKKLIAAVAIATATVGANAANYTLGAATTGVPLSFNGRAPVGTFSDTFSFLLPANSGSGYSVIAFDVDELFVTKLTTATLFQNLDGVMFSFDDTPLVSAVSSGSKKLDLSFGALAAGSYYLNVAGITAGELGGLYNGAISVAAPLPELETYAMLLAGLGLMGTIARRRSKSKAV